MQPDNIFLKNMLEQGLSLAPFGNFLHLVQIYTFNQPETFLQFICRYVIHQGPIFIQLTKFYFEEFIEKGPFAVLFSIYVAKEYLIEEYVRTGPVLYLIFCQALFYMIYKKVFEWSSF